MYGQSPNAGSVLISIDPADKVIVGDPSIFSQFTGTVAVTEPGEYTVSLSASISFGELGGCSARDQQTVDVTCDPAPSPH
jgi:hypothetical protein